MHLKSLRLKIATNLMSALIHPNVKMNFGNLIGTSIMTRLSEWPNCKSTRFINECFCLKTFLVLTQVCKV